MTGARKEKKQQRRRNLMYLLLLLPSAAGVRSLIKLWLPFVFNKNKRRNGKGENAENLSRAKKGKMDGWIAR